MPYSQENTQHYYSKMFVTSKQFTLRWSTQPFIPRGLTSRVPA